MTIPALLQFRKNSLNASISISDHFRLCPQPSGDNISVPQVYSAALTVDHNINDFVNFLRLSTYTAGHIRLNLAAEVVPFFTTNSVVWWKVLDQRKFGNFSDHDHPLPHNILQNYRQCPLMNNSNIWFETFPYYESGHQVEGPHFPEPSTSENSFSVLQWMLKSLIIIWIFEFLCYLKLVSICCNTGLFWTRTTGALTNKKWFSHLKQDL